MRPPFNIQGGGARIFVKDLLFISARLGCVLKIKKILPVYIEQFLKQIIHFMQNLLNFFFFLNTPALTSLAGD